MRTETLTEQDHTNLRPQASASRWPRPLACSF